MIPAAWDPAELEPDDPSAPGRPTPTLVSLHFLKAALRRRRVAWLTATLIGLLASAAFLFLMPPPRTATAMLVLAHDPSAEADQAMTTDISLLNTRTVAQQTIERLSLPLGPQEFQQTFSATPASSGVMQIELKAPDYDEAVRRLQALTAVYLTFRNTQITRQSNYVIDATKQRIAASRTQIDQLNQRIDQLSGTSATSELNDAITQRGSISARMDLLEQQVQDETLQTTSIVSSSRVIDAPAAVVTKGRKRLVLTLASGVIGGAGLGIGLVLFQAITSDRLRRRFEVSAALGAPVPVSVGRLAPLPRVMRSIPPLKSLHARRDRERQLLAHAIGSALAVPHRRGALAVGCIDNADEVRFAVVTAAADMIGRGHTALLIDLSDAGQLADAVDRLIPPSDGRRPTVLRPYGVPALAKGLPDLRIAGQGDAVPEREPVDVLLILADIDPAVGAAHLVEWTDWVVLAVTAGRSSAERVRTAGDLVRAAGLHLSLATMIRLDMTDESSGTMRAQAESQAAQQ